MKKMIAICMLSFFSVTSLYSAVTVEQNNETQKISFNIKLNSREDVFEAVELLQRMIPLLYMEEIGTDEAKRDIILKLNASLDAAMCSSSFDSVINEVTARFLEIKYEENASLSELVICMTEALKTVEDAHVFSTLHMFFISNEGKELLQLFEVACQQGLKKVPMSLVSFYILREAAYQLQKEEAQRATLELV